MMSCISTLEFVVLLLLEMTSILKEMHTSSDSRWALAQRVPPPFHSQLQLADKSERLNSPHTCIQSVSEQPK